MAPYTVEGGSRYKRPVVSRVFPVLHRSLNLCLKSQLCNVINYSSSKKKPYSDEPVCNTYTVQVDVHV